MKHYLLEACIDSFASAMAAEAGGAMRYELCANLVIGGTTPSIGLFKRIKAASDLPIRVLIRPRFGDFLYTEDEIAIMEEDIRLFRELGAEGIVTGALNPDGTLNVLAMRRFKQAAGPLGFTLHRAIDVSQDAFATLETAIDLGVDTILTSGQAASAIQGRELLGRLQAEAGDRLTILVAAGVSADVIRELGMAQGLFAFHLSGKEVLDSKMEFRRPSVSMGLPGLSEFEIWQTAEAGIRAARNCLDELADKATS